MIAYNHLIKFNPPLSNDKKILRTYSNTITVQQGKPNDSYEQLPYRTTFNSNQGRDLTLYGQRTFSSPRKGALWAFEVKGVVTFCWQSGRLIFEYIKGAYFTEALLEYWCLQILFPLYFTIEESYHFLHAGAVEVANKPILLVAESFGGKSTMTDFFMKQGHALISDDKVATYEKEGVFYAVPSHPHHRPHRGMEDLGFFAKNVAHGALPIHSIYEMEKNHANADIEIVQLNGVEKFKALAYSSEFNLPSRKANQFEYLSHLIRVIPIFRVSVPWNMDRLCEVHDKVVAHSEVGSSGI